MRRYWTTACRSCAIVDQCTTGKERRITRWEHEHILEDVQRRVLFVEDPEQVVPLLVEEEEELVAGLVERPHHERLVGRQREELGRLLRQLEEVEDNLPAVVPHHELEGVDFLGQREAQIAGWSTGDLFSIVAGDLIDLEEFQELQPNAVTVTTAPPPGWQPTSRTGRVADIMVTAEKKRRTGEESPRADATDAARVRTNREAVDMVSSRSWR